MFGDDEAVAVMFTYGEAEHGILVQVDLAGIPVATAAGLSSNADRLIEAISGGIGEEGGEFDRSETISLADARRHIAGPLDRMDRDPGSGPVQQHPGLPAAGQVPGPPAPGGGRRAAVTGSPPPTARPRSTSS